MNSEGASPSATPLPAGLSSSRVPFGKLRRHDDLSGTCSWAFSEAAASRPIDSSNAATARLGSPQRSRVLAGGPAVQVCSGRNRVGRLEMPRRGGTWARLGGTPVRKDEGGGRLSPQRLSCCASPARPPSPLRCHPAHVSALPGWWDSRHRGEQQRGPGAAARRSQRARRRPATRAASRPVRCDLVTDHDPQRSIRGDADPCPGQQVSASHSSWGLIQWTTILS